MNRILSNKKLLIGIVVAILVIIVIAVLVLKKQPEKDKLLLKCTFSDLGGEYDVTRVVTLTKTTDGDILSDKILTTNIKTNSALEILDLMIKNKIASYDSKYITYKKSDTELEINIVLNLSEISNNEKITYIGTSDTTPENLKDGFESGGLQCEKY